MSKDDGSINREALLRTAGLVRPALATANYVPALQHILFDGKYASAFNDISAIAVRLEMPLERCVPGDLLIRALGTFSAENVAFAEGKEGALQVSSGRNKIKLPTLEPKAFPLEWPEKEGKEIELHPEIVRGIERCLFSVGSDPTHQETMGVTLDITDGKATLYSTDNFSLSRFRTEQKIKLPGDSPVLLPSFFCEQVIALSRAFPDEEIVLVLRADSYMAEFGKAAKLLTRIMADREPLDFPSIFKKHLKTEKLKEELVLIPPGFDSALQRALLVLQGEEDKITEIELLDGKGGPTIAMRSSSSMGDAEDKLELGKDEEHKDFGAPEVIHVDPALVARAAKQSGLLGFMPKAMVLADSEARFVHLVAYCAAR